MLLSVFIVLLPPLTVGLMYMANQVARGNAIKLDHVVLRRAALPGPQYLWGAINAFAIMLVLADLTYYQQLPAGRSRHCGGYAGDFAGAGLGRGAVLNAAHADRARPEESKGGFPAGLMLTISQPAFVIGLVIATALLVLLCWFFPIMIGFAFAYLALAVNIAIVKLRDPELDRQCRKRPRALP